MSKKLFRYIGFEDFINLAINNKDRFVRPSSWEDKYEGYLFSHMETTEDVHQIVSEMYYNLCPRNYYAIPDNYFRMWHSKWFTYAQCWSKHPETDAMWRCYSYGNRAIRIRTRDDKLLVHTEKIFPDKEQFSVYLGKVSYDLNKKSVLEQQIRQMKDSLLAHETYFHKRPAFRHEGEYRLLIADNSLYSAEGFSSFGVKFKIEEQVKNKTDEEIIEYVTNKICAQRPDWNRNGDNNVRIEDAGDISEFLEGVMVHPLAPQWYVDIIRDICQSKKIKFDGQSEIYTLK
ncbi:DUF2971 domain-containing protein [Lachnospiraceae bacterium]|uniref:DUF2971 domain-containing protein n=1 Tax=Parablautia intestinalis TaxID=2320100 RepID=UPI001361E948|nr:DUF2971 domain-containing protein [Parablautia intestinalis]NBH28677.1 DUF2971 domain-containing protein [Lachnospiraceae bacterium]